MLETIVAGYAGDRPGRDAVSKTTLEHDRASSSPPRGSAWNVRRGDPARISGQSFPETASRVYTVAEQTAGA